MLLKPYEIAFAIFGIIIGIAIGLFFTINYINIV